MNIIVYPALAQITVTSTLKNGFPLPKTIIPSSILVLNGRGEPVAFKYLAPSSQYYDDEEVEIIKDQNSFRGVIVSLTDKDVTINQNGRQMTIHKYDYINYSERKRVYPVLVSDNAEEVTILYLMNNIGFNIVGDALLEGNTLNLYLNALITNETGSLFDGNLILINGKPYYPSVSAPMAQSLASRSTGAKEYASDDVNVGSLEDYISYDVGPANIGDKEVLALNLIRAEVQKIYIHNVNENERVTHGYRFTAPERLPNSSINMFKQGLYIGTGALKETPVGEEAELLIGESRLLRCISKVEESAYKTETGELEAKRVDVKINTKIIYYGDEPATLMLRYPLYGSQIISACFEPEYKDGYAQWSIRLEPGQAIDDFNCNLTLSRNY